VTPDVPAPSLSITQEPAKKHSSYLGGAVMSKKKHLQNNYTEKNVE